MRYLILFLLLIPNLGLADAPVHAVAMHGAAKYKADAHHLDYANPDAPIGGTVVQSAIGSFDTLNPHIIKGKAAAGLHLTYDRLMQRVWDEPFTLYGLIAEKVMIPDDRSSITFQINPKARFHDGHPITAEDVIFSLKTLREMGRPNARRVYTLVDAIHTDHDRHIRFDLSKGYDRETVMILAMMPVLPKHDWDGKTFDETTLTPPLGSGPYRISTVDPGRSITYERVADYWAADHLTRVGHHNIQTLRFDYFRDDGVALQAFLSGDVDMRAESNPIAQAQAYQAGQLRHFAHQRPLWMQGFIMNTRRAPLDTLAVREALVTSFDYDWVNTSLMDGKAQQVNSLFTRTPLSADVTLPGRGMSQRQRLRRAGTLLDQADYPLQDGKRFALSLLLNNPEQEKIALYWAQTLKRLGIELSIRTLDTAQFVGALNEYDYDMVAHRWINSLSPGTEQMLYWSCDAANTQGSRNYAGLCSNETDELAARIADASTQAGLITAAQALDQAVMESHILVPLGGMIADSYALSEKIGTPDITPIYGPVSETWWVKTGLDDRVLD